MHNLTQRQIEILKAIIEEYINTAEPVGSETLEKKYSLSASPATIRNEMVKLSEYGYLKKPHSSAGRVPTPEGMKFYVRELMKEKELSTVEEVAMKENIWDHRERSAQCLKQVTKSLAQKTGVLAVAMTDDGDLFAAGYANILDLPEFYDIDITKALLSILDEYEYFHDLFASVHEDEDIHVLLGDELGAKLRGPYGLVYTHFETPMHTQGEIGVIGPVRLNYTQVVPIVRYYGTLVEAIAKGW
ncbi:MAG: hypothetical protein HY430_01685 [Candidatus Levybacteria bacterium]|nr:hypothetical protein [Candidatus Levybacteria bacterium]